MTDYRIVSHCNILYKIISKTLASRLKPLLHKCISNKQSSLVECKSILNNALISSEFIHHKRWKTKGKTSDMDFKINTSKEFDRTYWSYLLQVMDKMRFHMKQIGLIKLCLETINYHVKIMGTMQDQSLLKEN